MKNFYPLFLLISLLFLGSSSQAQYRVTWNTVAGTTPVSSLTGTVTLPAPIGVVTVTATVTTNAQVNYTGSNNTILFNGAHANVAGYSVQNQVPNIVSNYNTASFGGTTPGNITNSNDVLYANHDATTSPSVITFTFDKNVNIYALTMGDIDGQYSNSCTSGYWDGYTLTGTTFSSYLTAATTTFTPPPTYSNNAVTASTANNPNQTEVNGDNLVRHNGGGLVTTSGSLKVNFTGGLACNTGTKRSNAVTPLILELAPPCNAGSAAPALSATTASANCPDNASIASITASNTPANTTLKFYTATPVTSTTPEVSNPASVGAGTYYAAFYDATNGCWSPTTSITVTINQPAAPSLSSTSLSAICPNTVNLNSLVTSSTPAGTTLKWYTDNTYTTEYTTPTAATAGTYYAAYYASATCKSPVTAAVTVTINQPAAPTVSTNNLSVVCTNRANLDSLVTSTLPSGTTLRWYTDNTYTTQYTSTTDAAPGTYYATYYASATCKSPMTAAVTVTKTSPAAPTLSSTSLSAICPNTVNLNSLVTSSTPAGTTLKWYTDNTYTTEYTTPTAATAGTYYAAYYASATCKSPVTAAVTVAINQPAVPTLSSTSIAANCPNTANLNSLVTSGTTNLKWYTDNTYTTEYTTPTTATAGTYYAAYYISSTCKSPVTSAVTVSINPPINVTLSATSASNTCPGTTVDIAAKVTSATPTNFTLKWYTDAGLASAYTGSTTAAPAGTYYAVYVSNTSSTCKSTTPAGITVTINGCCNAGNVAPVVQ